MVLSLRFGLLSSLLVFAVGCGDATPAPRDPSATSTKPSAPVAEAQKTAPKPVTSLKRAAVKETIAQGLGVFLQNVVVEDWPVMHEGKFHGFKVRSLNADWLVDLKPGDVVTRINGVVPEHPEEADAAFRALEKASSLKVDYERDGKAKTLELPIVD
jgi:type II secretory pathway component PulC